MKLKESVVNTVLKTEKFLTLTAIQEIRIIFSEPIIILSLSFFMHPCPDTPGWSLFRAVTCGNV